MSIACIAMCFAVSCASTPSKEVLFDYSQAEVCRTTIDEANIDPKVKIPPPQYVVVDDHGRLAYGDTQIHKIITLLDEYEATGGRNILIYVHGGLNSEPDVEKLGERTREEMKQEGYFPLFLIWRTDITETYWEQRAYIRDGWRYEHFIWDTPLYWVTDLGQALVRAPLIYIKQLDRVIQRYEASPDEGWTLKNDLRTAQRDRYIDGAVWAHNNLIFAQEEDETPPRDAADYFTYISSFPVRTLTSPPIDGFGKAAWENMVRRARTTVHQAAEFDPRCEAGDSFGLGGFSKLFRALHEWLSQKDRDQEFRITVIGHSMGTIVLNELIRTYPFINYDEIVYMASAASTRDVIRVVVPYLRLHPSARFYSLMLHPRNEAWELTWGGLAPSGSLLEWIDEMYEAPETMLDRPLGKWRDFRLAKGAVDPEAQRQMVFKVFGVNVDKPKKHGDFNDADTCFWNPGFWVSDNFKWEAWNSLSENNGTNQKNRNRRASKSGNKEWAPPKSLKECKDSMR